MDASIINAPMAAPYIKNVQIELTTRCNFDCFYCAGRDLPQGDMPYEEFCQLLTAHIERYGLPKIVSLQGEGEPTLHHDFFRMADRILKLGSEPYTITNGTHKHPEQFIGRFKHIGVSIDTLDAERATVIGRHNLSRVLSFVEALSAHMAISIHTVGTGLAARKVGQWCRMHGYRHVVQPLQPKADYRYRYPQHRIPLVTAQRFRCMFLIHPTMRYYALDGTELPCCYIKNLDVYPGLNAMHEYQVAGIVPQCCSGCLYAFNEQSGQ